MAHLSDRQGARHRWQAPSRHSGGAQSSARLAGLTCVIGPLTDVPAARLACSSADVSEFRLCILMQRSASPFAIGNPPLVSG
jgi:hypothetical protein